MKRRFVVRGRVRTLLSIIALCLTMTFAAPPAAANITGIDGTAWAALTGKKQDEILQTLANELEAVRAGRQAQREADDKAAKTLDQLLDELNNPTTPGAFRTYSQRYAIMALQALRSDGKRFAEMAGEASAGNYDALLNQLPRAGAAVFADLVSEALEGDTKAVWDGMVARAGSLQQIGIAFTRGDVGSAFDLARDQARSELETAGQNAVAGAINWVVSDLGVQPGHAYLQIISYERAFIEWSRNRMARWFIKDCLDEYARRQAETGDANTALYDYETCTILGGYAAAEREFDMMMRGKGIDMREVKLQMLEAYRTTGTMPDVWIRDQFSEKKAAAESQFKQDLIAAHRELRLVGNLVAAVIGQRLAALVDAELSDEEKAELEAAARKALDGAKADADTVLRARDGALAACTVFEAAQAEAETLIAEADRLRDLAHDALGDARSIPKCESDADAAITAELPEAQRLQSSFADAVADAEAGLNAACSASTSVASAATKDASKAALEDTRREAKRVADAAATGQSTHGDLSALLQRVAQARASASNAPQLNMDLLRDRFSKIEAALQQLQAAGDGQGTEFDAKRAAMAAAVRRASGLRIHAEERVKKVHTALDPHTGSPLGAEVKAMLKSVDEALDQMSGCETVVSGRWSVGARSSQWQHKKLPEIPALAEVEAAFEAARQRCPAAAASAAADPGAGGADTPEAQIGEIFTQVDAETVLLDIARRGSEDCLAKAILAYDKAWLGNSGPPLRESILIVLDASGSMGQQQRMSKARASAEQVLKAIPAGGDVEVALMVFYDCGSIRLETPFTTDPGEIVAVLPNIQPRGSTPLAAATAKGKQYLRTEARGTRKRFILLTDGDESCSGDPVAAIKG